MRANLGFFAAFAAVKLADLGRGALFVFSRSSVDQLLETGEAATGRRGVRRRDRRVVVAWGGLRGPLSSAMLCARFEPALLATGGKVVYVPPCIFP